ncbi:MAG TPA: T9SS type A sorting domain-containing protein [Candidatus Cloacimonadota bacterium]|nr:T9SS type A sorting domain-containing protein [Candidatus Cloacimonadota bacterium]
MLPIKPYLVLSLMICVASTLLALVPPHPMSTHVPSSWEPVRIEAPLSQDGSLLKAQRVLPNNILVLRVQFSDVGFVSQPAYPDQLAHDDVFFNRWMLHLSDFFADASHYQYELSYTLHPEVITLPHPMAYYGGDTSEKIDARIAELARDLVDAVDDEVDFNQHGGLIIFHAGAGQESDINGIRTDLIWSTFLTRKTLQAAFAPNNDSYPGLSTDDGANLINIVIVPEHEFQDYFPAEGQQDAEAYLFSIYGVLTHQFAHIIGLPTLFDNDSSNGTSQGIGNWGLMGTGVWNASGYVPAQLSAWSRMFLGWETPISVSGDATGLLVDYFLDHATGRNRLYKLPISATEYFLIENRQQNPDGSLDPYSNTPSYTFKLLPEGEQDYYENYPLLPFFNFMENRYIGSEWDFFLPGLGGPVPSGQMMLQDGSGLLIWHIDEAVIAENFTTNFDRNRINADSRHKGVDLEEADGIQHLDTAIYDPYKWGSPFDAFRQDNNEYFGNPTYQGLMSLPTAESYYGGIPLEVYDIGPNGNQMSFSVRFSWRLSSDYVGPNPINAAILDLDGDQEDEVFYAMPDGELYAWDDEQMMPGFPQRRMPVTQPYVWDEDHLYLPMELGPLARLYRMNSTGGQYVFTQSGASWASHPVDIGNQLMLPLNVDGGAELRRYDKGTTSTPLGLSIDQPIASNLVWFRNQLNFLTAEPGLYYKLWTYDPATGSSSSLSLPIPADSTIVGIFKAPLIKGSVNGELLIQTAKAVYVFGSDSQGLPVFVFSHDSVCTAPLTLADLDVNGSLDIILGTENGVIVLDYSGQRMSPENLEGLSSEEGGFSAGALALDIDMDGKPELLGNFANNQIKAWSASFQLLTGFPDSFAERSRNLPLVSLASDGNRYIWSAADNGSIFRKAIPGPLPNDFNNIWHCEFGNLKRSASIDPDALPNSFESASLFVPNELYIFPNPLKSIYADQLTLNVMTNRDTPLEVQIFDIGGKVIFEQKSIARAYLRNREAIRIPVEKLASGVYITVVKAGKETKRLKFAVEN